GGAMTHYYLGKAYMALDKYGEAISAFEQSEKAGYDRDTVRLALAEAYRFDGRLPDALKLLDALSGAIEQTAEYLFQRALTVQGMGGSQEEYRALLERAVQADTSHAGALF